MWLQLNVNVIVVASENTSSISMFSCHLLVIARQIPNLKAEEKITGNWT